VQIQYQNKCAVLLAMCQERVRGVVVEKHRAVCRRPVRLAWPPIHDVTRTVEEFVTNLNHFHECGGQPYHGPCLPPYHQMSPSVAVSWLFLRTPKALV
jgi:hypothetical protein